MANLTGKSNADQTSILKLIFQATAIANLAANGASPITNIYVALHTADPTQAGDQTSSEATYTGYARVAVARTSAGWTVSGTAPTQCVNAASITFPLCTGGSNTITNFSVGMAASGASVALYGGPLTASLAVSNGITPNIASGALVITEA